MAYHTREAEGLTAEVSSPWPRRVKVTKAEQAFSLSIKEAEALVYILQGALRDAKEEDARIAAYEG